MTNCATPTILGCHMNNCMLPFGSFGSMQLFLPNRHAAWLSRARRALAKIPRVHRVQKGCDSYGSSRAAVCWHAVRL